MTSIACAFRVQHRHLWVVLARHGAWTQYPNGRWIPKPVWRPSNQSEVYCPECKTAWRTSAAYVEELQDADRSQDGQMPYLTNKDRRILAVVDEYPLTAELTYYRHPTGTAHNNRFLTDLGHQLMTFGSLTLPQIAAAEGTIMKQMEWQAVREERDRQRAAQLTQQERESGVHVPAGKHLVRGLIESVWREDPATHDTAYERTRMRVRAAEGFVVEATVPAVVLRRHGQEVTGRRIEMWITLKPKSAVAGEAWGSYPSRDSRLLDEEER